MTGEPAPDYAGRVAFALGHIEEMFAGTRADGLESLNALAARVTKLERERDDARQWGERQADLLTECATASETAEARVAVLTDALERIVRTHWVVNEPLYDHARCIAREALAAAGEPEAATP